MICTRDPTIAELAGKPSTRRRHCAPPAGKSTLNQLERRQTAPTRYPGCSATAIGGSIPKVSSWHNPATLATGQPVGSLG
jgi:hypothetical protein